MQTRKKALSLLLAFAMVLSMLPVHQGASAVVLDDNSKAYAVLSQNPEEENVSGHPTYTLTFVRSTGSVIDNGNGTSSITGRDPEHTVYTGVKIYSGEQNNGTGKGLRPGFETHEVSTNENNYAFSTWKDPKKDPETGEIVINPETGEPVQEAHVSIAWWTLANSDVDPGTGDEADNLTHRWITKVEFADDIYPRYTAYWFHDFYRLKEIVGMKEHLHTDNVVDMNHMFSMGVGWEREAEPNGLDVSEFVTDNVQNMSYLFYGCANLTTLDLSNFNTEKVTDMTNMFAGCKNLESLTWDNNKWKTDLVFSFSYMFRGCESLETLDLTNFDTQSLKFTNNMFQGCTNLKTLDLSSFQIKANQYKRMDDMFTDCTKLSEVKLGEGFKFMDSESTTWTEGRYGMLPTLTATDVYTGKWLLQGSDPVVACTAADLQTYTGSLEGTWVWELCAPTTYTYAADPDVVVVGATKDDTVKYGIRPADADESDAWNWVEADEDGNIVFDSYLDDDLAADTLYHVVASKKDDSQVSAVTEVLTPPVAPTATATSATTVQVENPVSTLEYGINVGADDEQWVKPDANGNVVFEGLTAATDYEVVARRQSAEEPNPNPISASTSVKTLPAATSSDDITVTDHSITIYPTVGGEEYIVLPAGQEPTPEDWENSQTVDGGKVTFDNKNADTEYNVYRRTAATGTTLAGVSSDPALVKTLPELTDEDGDGICEDENDKTYYPVDVDNDHEPDGYVPVEPTDKNDGSATDTNDKTVIPVDTNNDGVANNTVEATDEDGDGIYEDEDETYYPVDKDGDHNPDFYVPVDPTDKNDGSAKAPNDQTVIPVDTVNDDVSVADGTVEATDEDEDGVYEDTEGNKYADSDGDKIYTPVIAVDTDNDGVVEIVEATDEDGDGIYEDAEGNKYSDSDGDKIYTPVIFVDTDNDGVGDTPVEATDKDGDGIYEDENDKTYYPVDVDGDHKPDGYVPVEPTDKNDGSATDTNGDTVIPVDTNNDGVANGTVEATDEDGDGIYEDEGEDKNTYYPVDVDGDHNPDFYVPVDPTDKNDGSAKAPNDETVIPVDTNNDGVADNTVEATDEDGDGIYEDEDETYYPVDKDGDHNPDFYVPVDPTDKNDGSATDSNGEKTLIPVDTDNNGVADNTVEVTDEDNDGVYEDADGNRYADFDDDNNNIYTPTTTIRVDPNNDGELDDGKDVEVTDANGDGIYKDGEGNTYYPVDTDDDHNPDYYVPVNPTDKNDGSATDTNDKTLIAIDTDGDDVADDTVEADDADNDGVYEDADHNNKYTDSNSDGVYTATIPVDTDNDGEADDDVEATDANGDGIYEDGEDNAYYPVDKDGDHNPDFYMPVEPTGENNGSATDKSGNTVIPVDTDKNGVADDTKIVTATNSNGVYQDAKGNRYSDPNNKGVYTPVSRSTGNGGSSSGGTTTTTTTQAKPAATDPKNITTTLTAITIDPTVKGNQYIVVPKGTKPTDADWAQSQTSQNGEALTFDGLTFNTEYDVISRNADSLASDPTTAKTKNVEFIDEHVAYYQGCDDNSIRPEANLTRSQTAVILYRLLKDQDVTITKTFSDVPEGEWYTDAVQTLASIGVIKGYVDGTFRPDEPITRAEFVTMCTRFADKKAGTFAFSDVEEDYWAYEAIGTAASYGWIEGYDGAFRPNAYITRAEAARVVNRMLGRTADQEYIDAHEDELVSFTDLKNDWYYYDIIEATNEHSYTMEEGKEIWTSIDNQ